MNLLEAVKEAEKSGKWFKREKAHSIWFEGKEDRLLMRFLDFNDVFAKDWVVKEKEEIELKPCPFCGSKAEYRESIAVHCTNKECYLHIHEEPIPWIKEEVINKWNNRRVRDE